LIKKKFPHYQQLDAKDCGPTCLRMIAKHYGKTMSLSFLREKCYINKTGVSLAGISTAAENIGLRSLAINIPIEKIYDVPTPCILHWRERHFVVLHKVDKQYFHIADPAFGLIKYKKAEFLKGWLNNKVAEDSTGVALLIETTPEFFDNEFEKGERKIGFGYLFSYLKPYKKYGYQLWLGLGLGSVFNLIVPFLSQSLVDRGIMYQDINFIYLILIAQIVLFVSMTMVGVIRSWILLHVSTRINISLISNFLKKLMNLPMSFFDTRVVGDIMQRIGDHSRIESFMTASTLSVLFSVVNLFIFGFVLLFYSFKIFAVFSIASILYVLWILLFLKKRRVLDFKRFDQMADNQSKIVELISGIHDIKLNNCEQTKRWEWERIQASLFKVNIEGLALSQYQSIGSSAIHTLKNIVISIIAAKSVIDGEMTLGMMMAVQYIVGQVSGPINSLVGFVQLAQDAKISLERLGEIHNKEDEEPSDQQKIHQVPNNLPIKLQKVTFTYDGPYAKAVLRDIDLVIPAGKVTAIVGASGSGKTTLLKLLLRYYNPSEGNIYLENYLVSNFHTSAWRQACGVVMQEGFIYSDSIARNIALGAEHVDYQRLVYSVRMANIQDFIQGLPLGFNTKIGAEGVGMSQGQKQRLFIARAIYKNPQFLFFDEATSALDANNERVIQENLQHFFDGRTVIIVAHRLSTVKDADQIVVLDDGEIVEIGDHQSLTASRGYYYELVKNQLELGS